MRYEVLLLDRAHRVRERVPFYAPGDVEAATAAADLDGLPERELWCGGRIVKRWSPLPRDRATDTD